MTCTQNKKTIKTNSKRVWVGDPWYVIKDELWNDVSEQVYVDRSVEVVTLNYNGKELSFLLSETSLEGVYNSQTGSVYIIDTGCVAIVPEELIDGRMESLGHFIELESDSISLEIDDNETFYISDGDKVIETIWTGREEE